MFQVVEFTCFRLGNDRLKGGQQPLQCIMVPVVDEEQRAHIEAVKALIMNEVNVKEIKFVDGAAGVLVKKVKCDFKKLGPKFGKQMKAVALPLRGD